MIDYKLGDIILTEVIFAEKNIKKKRPAMILSDTIYHKKRKDVIIAAITGNTKRVLYGDTPLKDWKKEGLLFPSLLVGIIQTIKQNMIIRKFGEITNRDFEKFTKNFKKTIPL